MAQMLELLFFAVIAFFVIAKLISMLGTTTEDDPANKGFSFFGEKGAMRDVTPPAESPNVVEVNYHEIKDYAEGNLDEIIILENKEQILKGIAEANRLIPFKPASFLRKAKTAFAMIMETPENSESLEALIDKRYMDHFKSIHRSRKVNSANLEAKFSEIYTFGNSTFIKILFMGINAVEAISNFREEWTFTKNALTSGPEWYLTNIDRAS
jgi:predicted lipid-binding transport protein (Tim44 family)